MSKSLSKCAVSEIGNAYFIIHRICPKSKYKFYTRKMRNTYNFSLVITILDTIHGLELSSQEENFAIRDTFQPLGLNGTKGHVDRTNDRK
jgi:hypothetical protein